jgi:hypothetical protein
VWAGVDNAWEQEKLEARKILENAAESHTSDARFVRRFFVAPESLTEKRQYCQHGKFYTQLNFWQRQKRNLLK